ncbi:MAG: hypothetical protein BHW00_05300 [Clostridium sp. 26_22]|nr:MAG: hypothetical protein BHW00_05300 [Clostridium sp. 26_22]
MSCEKDKMICYDENKKLIQQILIDNKEKIIGYIRVSYSDDSEKEIKRQEDIIINFCKEFNVNCNHIYIDNGFSGVSFDRPGIKEIINVKEKKVLLMSNINILTRSYMEIQDFIKNLNISIISINDGLIIKR